jgi:hypothetical protein
MTAASPHEPAPGERARRAFGWPHAIVLIGLMLLVGAIGVTALFVRATREAGEAIAAGGREAIEQVQSTARAFRTGTITTTFRSHATKVAGTQRLQFATLDQVEVFERTDSTTVLWGQLALPDVVVRATAPVQYTYFLDLEQPWRFELAEDNRIQVYAPPIQFNQPAIDVSRLDYEVRADSLLRDEQRALGELKRGLAQMVQGRARDNIELVREIGRRKTEQFVEGWLFHDFGETARRYHVDVVFVDEVEPVRPRLDLSIEKQPRDSG